MIRAIGPPSPEGIQPPICHFLGKHPNHQAIDWIAKNGNGLGLDQEQKNHEVRSRTIKEDYGFVSQLFWLLPGGKSCGFPSLTTELFLIFERFSNEKFPIIPKTHKERKILQLHDEGTLLGGSHPGFQFLLPGTFCKAANKVWLKRPCMIL